MNKGSRYLERFTTKKVFGGIKKHKCFISRKAEYFSKKIQHVEGIVEKKGFCMMTTSMFWFIRARRIV